MADVVLNPGSAGLAGAGAPRVMAASGPVVLWPTGIDCRPCIGEPVVAVGEGPTDLTLALDGISVGSCLATHSIHAPVLTPGTFQPAGISVGGEIGRPTVVKGATFPPLKLFNPRHTFYLQGFSTRAATTTIHHATDTSIEISGIFQSAEDFAVLGFYNAYDYFNHLRAKWLPRRDLSNLVLTFDLEMNSALEGNVRIDCSKYPTVAWNKITVVSGAGDLYEVPLLPDNATIQAGEATPALAEATLSGVAPNYGSDWVHVYFRDARWTVSTSDLRRDVLCTTAVTADPNGETIDVDTVDGIKPGDELVAERTGLNEEVVVVQEVYTSPPQIYAKFSASHAAPFYLTQLPIAQTVVEKLAEQINADVSNTLLDASANDGTLRLQFKDQANGVVYGRDGNGEGVTFSAGHVPFIGDSLPQGSQQLFWDRDHARFSGGGNTYKYRITVDFENLPIPADDIRKVYMVFAPRYENIEEGLELGAFLTADVDVDVDADAVTWDVDSAAKLEVGRKYYIGSATQEERVELLGISATTIEVRRGADSSTSGAWTAGTRLKSISPVTGIASDLEWNALIRNISVEGDSALYVGGAAPRLEESNPACRYEGVWEEAPANWWSRGHAKRTIAGSVTIAYDKNCLHDLYLGTFLNTDCGQVACSVDGDAPTTHDLYLDEYGGVVGLVKLRGNLRAGTHTVVLTADGGGYFCFDYLWPLVPQYEVPAAPERYENVSLALDFDTDHGYKKPPAWQVRALTEMGFYGHADVYMGVFWNNKRRRINQTYPHCSVEFSGEPVPGETVAIRLGETTVSLIIGYGMTLQMISNHFRQALNGMYTGIVCDNNYGTQTALRIKAKAPSYVFDIGVDSSTGLTLTLTQGTPALDTPGAEGDWELIDAISPVMTEGARAWFRDLANEFNAAGINASFAFSMEVYRPPAPMAARYWDGAPVELTVPSTQMHFGPRVSDYLKQMYKEAADEIAAGGLTPVLQFGETQWWYFPNASGMPYYDDDTKAAFLLRYGRALPLFENNTDDPNTDIEAADFLRDRIWAYCIEVINYVRLYHPTAVFECLWPLDANQGQPAPDPLYRRLNMHVNLPLQWKTSAYGIQYFRSEGYDYDVVQKRIDLTEDTIDFPHSVCGRPDEECMFLHGIFTPDPIQDEVYSVWKSKGFYSLALWAFDQFCLYSLPLPLGNVARDAPSRKTSWYRRPGGARPNPVIRQSTPLPAPTPDGKLNSAPLNQP